MIIINWFLIFTFDFYILMCGSKLHAFTTGFAVCENGDRPETYVIEINLDKVDLLHVK